MYPIIDMKETGQNLKNICDMKNISASDIQRFLGLSCNNAIYRWFKGESLPSLDNLYALQELLGVDMDKILRGSYTGSSPKLYEVVRTGLNTDRLKKSREAYMRLFVG